MTTFLWMLYLAFTLLVTIINLFDWKQDIQPAGKRWLWVIINSLRWSIWYFYYLH